MVLLSVAGACGGRGTDAGEAAGHHESARSTTPAAPVTERPAPGAEPTCEDGALHERTFILCTGGDDPGQPLVLALHGRGSSAEDMRAMTRLDQAGADRGLAVAFPASMDGGWGDDTFTSPARPRGDEDVTFLDELLVELRADPRIDDRPVGVVGFSNGASMALRYAVERPADVRAVVAVAGQLPRDAAIRPHEPVPLLEVYGSADPIRSHTGGIPAGSDRRPGDPTPTLPTVETVGAFVAALTTATYDGPRETDPDPGDGTRLRTERWLGADGVVVVLRTVLDGGHAWPSAQVPGPPEFGRASRDLDASADAIAFITRHGRSAPPPSPGAGGERRPRPGQGGEQAR